jgi:hypothetical protein
MGIRLALRHRVLPLAPWPWATMAATGATMSEPRMKEERHPDHAPATKGNTVPVQGENQVPKARMPHERDESADSQAGDAPSARRMGNIAHDAVEQGQVDTDKGPVLDRAYDQLRDGEPKKRRP